MTMLIRVIRIGLVDFWRNRWLSLAATLMMTMTIFTVALFMIINWSIDATAKTLQEKIDIAVFFKDAATDSQIQELQVLLKGRPDVKEVQYVSRELALEKFRAQSASRPAVQRLLLQGYGNNLPRSLSVKATVPESLGVIAVFINQPPYDSVIERLRYEENKSAIDLYIARTQFVKKTVFLLSVLFTVIAVLVINNTIRLTIFMRKDEIEIMQLVGATAWYIKFPFIIEGILYGVIATIIATTVLVLGVRPASPSITQYIGNIGTFNFEQFFMTHLLEIVVVEVVIGVAMGILCSYFAVRKHLR